MWVELFLCLLLAHLVADFVFQTKASCQKKAEQGWHSPYLLEASQHLHQTHAQALQR